MNDQEYERRLSALDVLFRAGMIDQPAFDARCAELRRAYLTTRADTAAPDDPVPDLGAEPASAEVSLQPILAAQELYGLLRVPAALIDQAAAEISAPVVYTEAPVDPERTVAYWYIVDAAGCVLQTPSGQTNFFSITVARYAAGMLGTVEQPVRIMPVYSATRWIGCRSLSLGGPSEPCVRFVDRAEAEAWLRYATASFFTPVSIRAALPYESVAALPAAELRAQLETQVPAAYTSPPAAPVYTAPLVSVAELTWFGCVDPGSEPWVRFENYEAGRLWFAHGLAFSPGFCELRCGWSNAIPPSGRMISTLPVWHAGPGLVSAIEERLQAINSPYAAGFNSDATMVLVGYQLQNGAQVPRVRFESAADAERWLRASRLVSGRAATAAEMAVFSVRVHASTLSDFSYLPVAPRAVSAAAAGVISTPLTASNPFWTSMLAPGRATSSLPIDVTQVNTSSLPINVTQVNRWESLPASAPIGGSSAAALLQVFRRVLAAMNGDCINSTFLVAHDHLRTTITMPVVLPSTATTKAEFLANLAREFGLGAASSPPLQALDLAVATRSRRLQPLNESAATDESS